MVAGGGLAGVPPAVAMVDGRGAVGRVFVADVVLKLRDFVHPQRYLAADVVAEAPEYAQAGAFVKVEFFELVIETADDADERRAAQVELFYMVFVTVYMSEIVAVWYDESCQLVESAMYLFKHNAAAQVYICKVIVFTS